MPALQLEARGGQIGRRAQLTSVISKMLSGSRLPPPTFLVQVTVPLCVTEMMRLATEQAFSCRVASTTCRWPTCRKAGGVRAAMWCICITVCVILGFRKWAYLAQCHYTRNVFYIKSHTIIRVIWQLNFLPSFVVSWYMHFGNSVRKVIGRLSAFISIYTVRISQTQTNTCVTLHLLCVEESCLYSYWDGIVQVSITLQQLWKHISVLP